MRIGIDARFFGPKEKGLGIYVQKLVENLEKTHGNERHEFFIFLKKDRFDDFNPERKNFKKVVADFHWYSWKEQLIYPFFLNKHKLDLMHFCHFNVPILYRKKFVVTIHDLILFHYPTIKNTTLNKVHYLIKYLIYRRAIFSAARRALKVIAISKFTKKDLVKTLNVPENRVEVVYQGCNFHSQKSKKNASDILKKYGIIKPYLLYVGNAYPHKNLERLVRVFFRFNKKNPEAKLVLGGGKDYFYQRLEQKIKEQKIKNVIFPGFIGESEFGVVYKNSEMVVFPSLYEGFGFPPLEALIHGKRVACSNRASMPEILGKTVDYFDPENNDSILNCLLKVYKSKEKISKIETDKKIRKFSWDRTAKETLKIYENSTISK